MNRLTHAFSPAIPSASSDASSTFVSHGSPRASSPIETPGFAPSKKSLSTQSQMNDEIHSTRSPVASFPGSLPRRMDEASPRKPRTSKSVKVNLMASAAQGKRGWGMSNVVSGSRLTAMAQGPDGKFAVGGGQYLRVLQIDPPSSGDSTSISREPDRTGISEVVNLWRGPWAVGKGVNDLDWGVGGESLLLRSNN